MPSKRDVLAQLSRDELLAVVDRFELSVADRRVRDGLLEVVAASKKATLAELLPELSRDRLKELCAAFGLDEGGREKALLVDRLLGTAASAAAPSSTLASASNSNGSAAGKASGGARAGSGGAPAIVELPVGDKLTIDKLEGYLWSAADILRGSIDSSDYKGFIFGFAILTQEVFGADDRPGRSRVYAAMEQLRKTGKIDRDEDTGVWSVT